MWPFFFVMCITMGYFFHVWGGVGVGLFLVCFVISICTELLCFGQAWGEYKYLVLVLNYSFSSTCT